MDIVKHLIFISFLTLMACEPEEEFIPSQWKKVEDFLAKEQKISMGEQYENQVYYNLEKEAVVKTVGKMDWDFFWNGDSLIVLNSGRNMKVAPTVFKNFSEVEMGSTKDYKWDWSSGNPDSLAMSPLKMNNVYVLDLGLDVNNDNLGKLKMMPKKIQNDTFYFAYEYEGNLYSQYLIFDHTFNFASFSFLKNEQVFIEPPKNDYDLKFTQYIHYFEEEETDYLVVGVLLNPYKTKALKVKGESFDLAAPKANLSSKWDAIGYDWKRFDFDLSRYIIESDCYYQVETSKGQNYKMKFTSFTNENNVKGYPSFLFQSLM